MKFFPVYILLFGLLISCGGDSTSAENDGPQASSNLDPALQGTWVQVSEIEGPENRDTAIFTGTNYKTSFSDYSGSEMNAKDGWIGSKISGTQYATFEYAIEGDTLFLENVFFSEPDGTLDKPNSIRYVPIDKYTAQTEAIDPSIVGNGHQVINPIYPDSNNDDSIQITTTSITYTQYSTSLGVTGTAYARDGQIWEEVDGVRNDYYNYLLHADTLWINYASDSFSDAEFGHAFLRN